MQSTGRLHVRRPDPLKEPRRLVCGFPAPRLRRVGHGIPSGLFGAFVVGCVEVVRTPADDRSAKESFRWLLSLISLMLMGVTNEASRSS